MKIFYHPNFRKALSKFPVPIKNKFEKQATYLVENIRHPSLHAKKYEESTGIWQARVDKGVRFYFLIEDDTYILLDIREHD